MAIDDPRRADRGRGARVVTSRLGVVDQLREVVNYRELLGGLVRKELKVKYKDSVLGFLWSLLNPALSLAVFYVVFEILLPSGIPDFAIWLLSGLLVWNLFSGSLAAGTGSVVGAGGLVNKVWFPRLILPLASVGSAVVHFFLQGIVLVVVLVATRYDIEWAWLPVLVLAFVTLVVLSAGLAILLSAVNVYARDTGHVLELSLLAWFWLTPIIYPVHLQLDKAASSPSIPDWIPWINPITPIVVTFQRILHNVPALEAEQDIRPDLPTEVVVSRVLPDWSLLDHVLACGVVLGLGLALTGAAISLFGRLEGSFAEEM